MRRPRVDDPQALILARGGVRVAVVVPHDVLDQLVVCRERVDVHAGLDIPKLYGHVSAHADRGERFSIQVDHDEGTRSRGRR